MKLLVLIVLIFQVLHKTSSSKILLITSMPAHSHFTLTFRLAKELADREHQVTLISPYPQKTPIKNFRDVSIAETIDFVKDLKKTFLRFGSLGAIGSHLIDSTLGPGITEYAFNSTGAHKLLHSKETFDVVIVEHFINEALVGYGHHFKAPIIVLAPVPSCFRNNYLFGNPSPSSYVPDILGKYTKHMNFWQRLYNFITINFHDIIREGSAMPKQRALFKKYITTDLELDDILYNNVSLILSTSHPSVTDAVPHLPNIIEIGGYHVSPPQKLPKDLQQFLDDAKEGVIVFSMGSNLKSKDLTLEVRKAVLKAFTKIKAKVLWKFEVDLPEAPKNVKIMKWLPQQDVLGHPNVKGFITHGGLLSSIEAVYFGVPLIGIPIFGDQRSNIASAVSHGYAISVPLDDLKEENFLAALNEILYNPKYRNNVKHRSRLMHDQPLKPIDSAVYWIEYVIRHKGAQHLRASGSDLKWYQREMLDIITVITIATLTLLGIIYKFLKIVLRTLLCKKTKRSEKKIVGTKKKQ